MKPFQCARGVLLLAIAMCSQPARASIARGLSTDAAGSAKSALAAKVDAYFAPQVSEHLFSGAVLITQNDKPLIDKGYGLANVERNVPVGVDTAFAVASLTKAFTATAVLQLKERGKIRFKDHMCHFMASCPQSWKGITVEQLLTMTSGLQDFGFIPDEDMVSADKMFAYLGQQPISASPGAKWSYNDFSYRFLGYIVQKASGEGYESYIQKHIFRPLGMRHSSFVPQALTLPNLAVGYQGSSPIYLHSQGQLPASMSFFYAAGGIVTTLSDLRRWDHALNTSRVLPSAAIQTMFTAHVKTNIPPGGPPLSSSYGYGWFIDKLFNRRVVQHPGGAGPHWAYHLRFPDQHTSVVVLCNRPESNRDVIITNLARIVLNRSST